MKRNHEEHNMQAAFFKACEHIPLCRFMFAVPNAMPGDVKAQVWMNAEGRRKGVPDIFLPYPSGLGPYFFKGLFLEAKTSKGKLTEEQADFLIYADSVGYGVGIFRSVQEGIDIINRYLRGLNISFYALKEAKKKLRTK